MQRQGHLRALGVVGEFDCAGRRTRVPRLTVHTIQSSGERTPRAVRRCDGMPEMRSRVETRHVFELGMDQVVTVNE